MKTSDVPFAAIDFESAGTAPGLTDEPVQVAIVHWQDNTPLVALNSHLRPTRPVTWAAQQVHGISDSQLSDAPRLVDLWPRVKSSLEERWVVAHGAATEKRFPVSYTPLTLPTNLHLIVLGVLLHIINKLTTISHTSTHRARLPTSRGARGAQS